MVALIMYVLHINVKLAGLFKVQAKCSPTRWSVLAPNARPQFLDDVITVVLIPSQFYLLLLPRYHIPEWLSGRQMKEYSLLSKKKAKRLPIIHLSPSPHSLPPLNIPSKWQSLPHKAREKRSAWMSPPAWRLEVRDEQHLP